MKWVTWKNIGVDRMACAWLIRRRIDPEAEFSLFPWVRNHYLKMVNHLIFQANATPIMAVIAHFMLF